MDQHLKTQFFLQSDLLFRVMRSVSEPFFGEMTGQKISIVGCNEILKSLKRWEKLLIFVKWTYNMAYSD